MPLPAPILDDRSYEQLRDELIRRIPVYTDEWTDHNPSDPGITLIELFAFLGETLLFRFNQIPETTNLAFLRLLHLPLRAAESARGIVTFSPTGSDDAPTADGRFRAVLVPQRTEVRAGDIPFETLDEVQALPITAEVLVKARTHDPSTQDEQDLVQAAADALGVPHDKTVWAHYETKALRARGDSAAEPLDITRTVDGMIWLAILKQQGDERRDLRGAILNVGCIPEDEVDPIEVVDECPGLDGESPTPSMYWQATAGIDDETGLPVFQRLRVIGDSTAGLTRSGIVRLELPNEENLLAAPTLTDPDQIDLAGVADHPPLAEGLDPEDVLFWIRGRQHRSDTPLPRFTWVGVNATRVEQVRTARPEFLGTGTGQPDQTYRVLNSSVVPATVTLQTEEGEQWVSWREVSTFDASAPDDHHFILDPEAGALAFGNGLKGRPPQPGERIRVLSYKYGGGVSGNVPARSIGRLSPSIKATVENPFPTAGGADREQTAEALERIPGEIRRRDRAVTASDFRELAVQTPGADIVRAATLARFDPRRREIASAGAVSVIVWPRSDPKHPNAPMPTRSTLQRVCAWLDERRLITTALWVIPPTYRRLAVSIGLQVKQGYGVEAVRRWVELAVRQYLAPVPPYGPDGGGWPLGRTVRGAELEAAALQVEGVEYIEGDIAVAYWDAAVQEWVRDGSNTVTLEKWEVPELWELTVVSGSPLEPGLPDQPAPPPLEPPRQPESVVVQPPPPSERVVGPPPAEAEPGTVAVGVPVPLPRPKC